MRYDQSFDGMGDRDELIIPSKNGYVVIPAENLRGNHGYQRKQVQPDRSTGRFKKTSIDSFRLGNILQFSLMILGMISLLGYIGWVIGGMIGLMMVAAASIISFLIGSNMTVEQMLRFKKVRQIGNFEGSGLFSMLDKLSRKAKLKTMPMLFLDERSEINAFTMADKDKSAIVLSRGLVNNLSQRELYGVLAHEVAHLKNGDIRLMYFSEQIRRLTAYMALAGQVLLIFYLPLVLLGQVLFPWTLVAILVIAPILSQLIQVAMSRNREFNADYEAVELSNDPVGLASALKKISIQTKFWKKIYSPYVNNVPELLRTHPNTENRIERLLRIQDERDSRLVWEQ